jgi:uncharacterized protein YjbJ (UPF0337 family)
MARIHSNPFKFFQGETVMNKDQVKGTFKDIAGKAQEQTGKLVGNKEQQAKGLLKQAEGKAEKKVGDVKEIVKDASHQP